MEKKTNVASEFGTCKYLFVFFPLKTYKSDSSVAGGVAHFFSMPVIKPWPTHLVLNLVLHSHVASVIWSASQDVDTPNTNRLSIVNLRPLLKMIQMTHCLLHKLIPY